MRLSSLRSGGLPLHASIGRTNGMGLASIGAAGSGKTGVLLALLHRGGEWVCDDQAFCDPDLTTVHGYARTMEVKHDYFREQPNLLQWTTIRERQGLKVNAATRRMAGICSSLPLGTRTRHRLKKISRGQARLHISPAGHIESATIDTLLLIRKGQATRLEPMDPEAWALQAGQLLWLEVQPIHHLYRTLQTSAGATGLGDGTEDEHLLKKRVRAFARDKRTFLLMRAPETKLHALDHALAPLWSSY